MHTWIDNTALHGAARCIQGVSQTEHDVRNLLQLATLFVFSEKLELGGFEHPDIKAASIEFVSLIYEIGVPKDLIQSVELTPEQYESACLNAAESGSDDILAGQSSVAKGGRTAGFDIPIGAIHPFERLSTVLWTDDAEKLIDVAANALELKAGGAIDLMVAKNPLLRHNLRQLATRGHWNEASSFHISAYLRWLLNREIAEARHATYFPASNRGEFMKEASNRVNALAKSLSGVDRPRSPMGTVELLVTEIPDIDSASDIQLGPIGVYLLEKSRGFPQGIIEAAIGLRERMKPVRATLEKIRKDQNSIDAKRHQAAKRAQASIIDHIETEFGRHSPPSLIDVLKFEWVIGDTLDSQLSVFMNPAKELVNWLAYQRNKQRYFGIFEIASVYSRSAVDSRHLLLLSKNARRHV
jgi:hypothetical protein